MVIAMNTIVLWDVTQCSLVDDFNVSCVNLLPFTVKTAHSLSDRNFDIHSHVAG
jgi:hypothetical protein